MNRKGGFGVAVAGLILAGLPCTAQLQPARTIILIGPPGSGKTVQADYLRKRYKIPAISMAQLLEHEVNRKSAIGRSLAGSVASGELLSDDSANEIMHARLLQADAGKGFILDGYPVSPGQAKVLDAWLVENGLPKPAVIIIDVPDDVSRTRLLKRHRADDTPANIDRRLQEYKDIGRVVEGWYGSQRTARVDGTAMVPEVAKRVATAVESIHEQKQLKTRDSENEGLKRREPQP